MCIRDSLDPVIGSEQGGTRPVLIIQNNVGNRFSPTTIVVAAVTSRTGKAKLCLLYTSLAREKGLTLHFDTDRLTDCFVKSDELLLNQIFTNLLGNAVKFTPEKGRCV